MTQTELILHHLKKHGSIKVQEFQRYLSKCKARLNWVTYNLECECTIARVPVRLPAPVQDVKRRIEEFERENCARRRRRHDSRER